MKSIVIIAHDAKKPELVEFLKEHQEWVRGVDFVATGRTAEFVEGQGIKVRHLSQGSYGGYRQITDMIENNEVDLVFFFRDPYLDESHHEDIKALLKACNVFNIPYATNFAAAELLILGLIKKAASERLKRIS
jgi:methylglyoxal synthase